MIECTKTKRHAAIAQPLRKARSGSVTEERTSSKFSQRRTEHCYSLAFGSSFDWSDPNRKEGRSLRRTAPEFKPDLLFLMRNPMGNYRWIIEQMEATILRRQLYFVHVHMLVHYCWNVLLWQRLSKKHCTTEREEKEEGWKSQQKKINFAHPIPKQSSLNTMGRAQRD